MATSAEDPPQWSAGRAVPRPVSQPSPPCACACLAPSALWTPPSSFSSCESWSYWRTRCGAVRSVHRPSSTGYGEGAHRVCGALYLRPAPSPRSPPSAPAARGASSDPRSPRTPAPAAAAAPSRSAQPARHRRFFAAAPGTPRSSVITGTSSALAIRTSRPEPTRFTPFSYFCTCWNVGRSRPRARSATSSWRVDERGCCGRRSRRSRQPGGPACGLLRHARTIW